MSTKELEAVALKLAPRARARLAEKLLESLEDLPEAENARLWADEARRRDRQWRTHGPARPSSEVLRDARAKLR